MLALSSYLRLGILVMQLELISKCNPIFVRNICFKDTSMSRCIPRIAVCLASFNGEEHILEQLNSISNQTNVDVSIFVSDDCSEDNTYELLNNVARSNENIVLLQRVKCGSAAKNFFRTIRDIDLTAFDYIALSDQDDIWQPDKLAHATQMIAANNVDVYSGNIVAFWPNGAEKLINKAQPQVRWDFMLESAGPGCTFVLSKKIAVDLQNFLIANANELTVVEMHDWFIYAFARSRGFKWYIDHESHMLYRQHANNVIGANVGFKANLARWGKLREGWLVDQALIIAKTLGYADAWPIKKLQRHHFLDRLALIANVNQLRRRLRDRIALLVFLLLPFKE